MVEVAASSLRKDRRLKSELYARASIAELWLVNLAADVIEVHTEPRQGAYTRISPARPGEVLRPVGLPGVAVAVSAVLGR